MLHGRPGQSGLGRDSHHKDDVTFLTTLMPPMMGLLNLYIEAFATQPNSPEQMRTHTVTGNVKIGLLQCSRCRPGRCLSNLKLFSATSGSAVRSIMRGLAGSGAGAAWGTAGAGRAYWWRAWRSLGAFWRTTRGSTRTCGVPSTRRSSSSPGIPIPAGSWKSRRKAGTTGSAPSTWTRAGAASPWLRPSVTRTAWSPFCRRTRPMLMPPPGGSASTRRPAR